MLKRILVLLGESAASVAARNYAFRLAQEADVSLAGIAGVDLSGLQMPSLGRAGTAGLQVRMEEDLRHQAEEARRRLRATYQRECDERNVTFEWLSFEGDPVAALHQAEETRDLVVTGHDTTFQGKVEQPLPELLSKLLALTPRPVVVCGDEVPESGDVVVAYDASVPAMRALQMFALIGLGRGRKIKVVTVDPKQEEAARRAEGAEAYLLNHGYEAEALPITSRLDPTDVLHLEVTNLKARTLVMGSYGRRGWREFLFGSTTGKLVENPPCALFVYH